MMPVRRLLLWSVALIATVIAVVSVDDGDDELISLVSEGGNTRKAATNSGPLIVLSLEKLQARDFDDIQVDLLAAKSWYVPPPPSTIVEKPKPPPLPFVFIGRSINGEHTEVFLSMQESSRIVRVGDIVEKIWRVESIETTEMIFTYLPLGEKQTLFLGDAP